MPVGNHKHDCSNALVQCYIYYNMTAWKMKDKNDIQKNNQTKKFYD